MIRIKTLDQFFENPFIVPYINLTWVRRYYGYGEFALEMDVNSYNPNAAYIYSPDRPEVGVIQSVKITHQREESRVLLSGYFIEVILDDKIIFPVYNGSGNIETIARDMFNKYKRDLPITLGAVSGIGSNVVLQETGAMLGTRLFELLETQQISLRVNYDRRNNALTFNVYQGLDRTSTQDVNQPIVFSTQLGNISELTYLNDISNEKNYAIIGGEGEGADRVYTDYNATGGGYQKQLFVDARDLRSDDLTNPQYIQTLKQRGQEKLLDYQIIEDVEITIDPFIEGRQYMIDFDLGDRVDVVIRLGEALNVAYTARITEVVEVIKENDWQVDISIGDKAPTIIQKAER